MTGGSDGIGLAMCKNLAFQGFNICIVARDEKKMKEKLDLIKNECLAAKTNEGIETMYIVADFS